MAFYAHSTGGSDRSNWHGLLDHLKSTAALAQAFADSFGAGRAAFLAGLLHDLGKYNPRFQKRLEGADIRVDHSTAGARLALDLAKGNDRLIAELVAYAIAGHHAGLPDRNGASRSTLTGRLEDFSLESLDVAWQDEITADATSLVPDLLRQSGDKLRLRFRLGFLGRMIFSCLVDADYRDTEAFFARLEQRQVDRTWPALGTAVDGYRTRFERHMEELPKTASPVNDLRARILEHVRSRAADKPGFFTLTVPTGGGKTLASLGFALDHAKAHGHARIIYAIPFTTIIDQTADIFRKVLGDDAVLEHHSAIEEEDAPGEGRESRDKLKLAMEDWAAPVVVTTSVQFFESLFAARPSRCRKLHNIADSVIILDEVQTLPRPLLAPAVFALRELAENYGCTVVLCTATQPALDERNFAPSHTLGLPLAGRELAPDPMKLARDLRRVRLQHAGPLSDAALVAGLADTDQGLVIVNSRKHALALYRTAQDAGLDGLVHLTTRQHATDRREILKDVRYRLTIGQPCRVIATSLVEAGVDIDFPRVWRAETGLDGIMQAAGRCNREGKRPVETSVVTVFSAPDHPPPPEIRNLASDFSRILPKHTDLLSPGAVEDFFGEVYWRIDKEGVDKKHILDDFHISAGITDFAYRTVAEKFQMIESNMLPVIVPSTAEAKHAVARLAAEQIPSGAIARELQRFTVQVPARARSRLLACGHVIFAEQRLRGDQFALLQNENLYDKDVGLIWEDAEYLKLEDSIV